MVIKGLWPRFCPLLSEIPAYQVPVTSFYLFVILSLLTPIERLEQVVERVHRFGLPAHVDIVCGVQVGSIVNIL